ncbi:MAG TPA: transcriptional antiterminator, Rof [Gammaproteobacteria bacterium]|nr:transcriptional antiterminator, Rof [Gammaproteobacteria bacterium]
MTDYIPVDCGLHSEYELAIMHQDKLELGWRDADGKVHIEMVFPLDLRTRNSEEFMVIAGADGTELEIRLDHITHFSRP